MNPPRPQKKTGRQKNIGWSLNARLLHPQSKGALPKAQKMALSGKAGKIGQMQKKERPENSSFPPGRLNR